MRVDEKTLRKVDRYRNRILHCESVLKRNSLIAPIALPMKKKHQISQNGVKDDSRKPKVLSNESGLHPTLREKKQKNKSTIHDLWAPAETEKNDDYDFTNITIDEVPKKGDQKKRRKYKSEKIYADAPALEVDMPGCSFNPTYQAHQDALAIAVAHEMKKEYKKELQPQPLFPSGSHQMLHGIDDVDDKDNQFLLEAGLGLNTENNNEYDEDDDKEEDSAETFFSKAKKEKRLTRADKNRRMKRKAMERELERLKAEKRKKRDVDRMKMLIGEIKEKEEDDETKRIRKKLHEEEIRTHLPPILGPYKFEAEPVQVLLTEEVTGSLRELKGCSSLSRDRFKSIQRRGLIEPRKIAKKKVGRKWRIVEMGSKGRKERELKMEIDMLRAERKEMEAAAKANSMQPNVIE